MISESDTEFIKSGSSERRSRSPAIKSIAMLMLPLNAATSANTDAMTGNIRAPAAPPLLPPPLLMANTTSPTTSGPMSVYRAADTSARPSRR